jgi:hypothetical protein
VFIPDSAFSGYRRLLPLSLPNRLGALVYCNLPGRVNALSGISFHAGQGMRVWVKPNADLSGSNGPVAVVRTPLHRSNRRCRRPRRPSMRYENHSLDVQAASLDA